LRGWGPGRAGRFAGAAGALVVTRRGAMTALPTRARVERFLQGQG
ncbi:MAG: 5-dehydro-2-deoxygluconokinase, partial [Euryarchaeota archaeon]|nr:5-dehydro-2-deoxygluconokinase [Euryarchaeota archaeon]